MTRALRPIACIVLLWGAFAFGQDGPTIKGPGPIVAAHRLARFSIDGADGSSALWEVTPLTGDFADRDRPVDLEPPDGRGPTLAFPGPPGKYKVVAYAVAEGKITRLPAVTVLFAECKHDGPPTDDPPPPDDDPPAEVSAIRTAGRAYSQGNSDVLRSAAKWLKANPGATKGDLIKWMAPRRAGIGDGFNKALDAAIDRHTAADGSFTDPAAVVKALDEAGKGVGSP